MLDRRQFLGRAAAGSVALAGGGLLRAPSAFAAKSTGFEPGQKPPKVSGLEQYGGKAALSHLHHRWVLLDVCAVWCGPCNQGAAQYNSLIAEADSQGVPLSMFSVLREGSNPGVPSTRKDAENWAHRYAFERDSVLHCSGSIESPLLGLLEEVCGANEAEPAYPCYLLIDPWGVIRYFQQGVDTNKLKAKLAKAAGVSLNGDYSEFHLPPNTPNIVAATVSFGIQGGATVSETVALGVPGSNCTLSVIEQAPRVQAFLTLPEGQTVDMNVPISIFLHTDPQRNYLSASAGGEISGGQALFLFDGPPEEGEEAFPNLVAFGGGEDVVNPLDASGSGISPVNPTDMQHGPDWGAPVNVMELELYFAESTPPYTRALQIGEELAKAGGSKEVQKLLAKGRKDMGRHDFAAAAAMLAQATTILNHDEATAAYVAWLAKP